MNATASTDQPLEQWRELFEHAAPGLPGDVGVRRAHLERFADAGFPTKRLEDWKYTDLSGLAKTVFSSAASRAVPELACIEGTERLLFVNGRFAAGDEHRHGLDSALPVTDADVQDNAVTALNAALAADGLQLHLQSGEKLPRPLHVLSYRDNDGEPSTSHLHHRIVLADNAEAEVIVESRGTGHYLGTDVLDIVLGAGSRLRLYRVQDVAAEATEIAATTVDLGRDARLEAFGLDLGQGLARHDFNIVLNGKGSEASLQALGAADQRAHVDNHVRIEHRAPHARSRINYRGIAGGRSRLIFDGLIVAAKGAVKTDSDQRLATLLLSSKAEINVKPELLIYNDDVRCNHGAATGQLDPHALFYLRSRGLDAAAARELLTFAFVAAVLESFPLEALREALRERLAVRLRQLLADAAAAETVPDSSRKDAP